MILRIIILSSLFSSLLVPIVFAQEFDCTQAASNLKGDANQGAFISACNSALATGKTDGTAGNTARGLALCRANTNNEVAYNGCTIGYAAGYSAGRQAAAASTEAADGAGTTVEIPSFASASTTGRTSLIVPIGGVDSIEAGVGPYIRALYTWGIGLGALLAMAMIAFGAVEYTASAGNVGSRESATNRIKQAVFGLILLLSAVIILNLINPNLQSIGISRDATNSRPISPSQTVNSTVIRTSEVDSEVAQKATEAATRRLEGASAGTLLFYNQIKNSIDSYVNGDGAIEDVKKEIKRFYDAYKNDFNMAHDTNYITREKRDVLIATIGYLRENANTEDFLTATDSIKHLSEYFKPDPYGLRKYPSTWHEKNNTPAE